MVNFHLFFSGFLQSITPMNLIVMVIALAAGILVGTLPGLTATMAVALLVPLTFAMNASTGLLMLGAIYTGAIYGGANAAILINTPGTPSAVATTFDGFPMTKRGKAAQAMLGALVGAVVGGLIGTIFLLFVSKPLSSIALSFGPTEVFWLALFGLTTIGSMTSGNAVKGLIAALIGLAIALTGLDPIRAFPRYTYGVQQLVSGINLIPAMIGFFSLSQLLSLAASGKAHVAHYNNQKGVVREVLGYTFRKCKTIVLRSSLIGTFVGVLPGAGGEIAAIISYNESRRWSKTPKMYGTGVLEGVLASESAANAMVGGSLVPMLTLGIPGSSVAAVLMGGLLSHGLIPGAKFLSQNGDVAYTFMIGLVIAQLLMFFVGYIMLRLLVKALSIRIEYIISVVIVLSVIGAYSISGNMIDVVVMFVCGIIGFFLLRVGLDPGPLVLGLILGEIVERGFVQGMLISHETSVIHAFFLKPIDAVMVILIILSALSPLFLGKMNKGRADFDSNTVNEEIVATDETPNTDAPSAPASEQAQQAGADTATTKGNSHPASNSTKGLPFLNRLSMRVWNYFVITLILIWSVYLFLPTFGMPRLSAYYPRVVTLVMVALTFALLWQTFAGKSKDLQKKPFADVRWKPVLIVLIGTALLIVGMATLGFYVSSLIVSAGMAILLGRRTKASYFKAGGIALLTTVLVYAGFWLFLHVSTPQGLLI